MFLSRLWWPRQLRCGRHDISSKGLLGTREDAIAMEMMERWAVWNLVWRSETWVLSGPTHIHVLVVTRTINELFLLNPRTLFTARNHRSFRLNHNKDVVFSEKPWFFAAAIKICGVQKLTSNIHEPSFLTLAETKSSDQKFARIMVALLFLNERVQNMFPYIFQELSLSAWILPLSQIRSPLFRPSSSFCMLFELCTGA